MQQIIYTVSCLPFFPITMTPQLLFIRKDRRLTPLIAGLMAIGLLSTGSMAYWYWMVRHRAAVLTRMTVQVEAAPLQVCINASGKVQPIQTVNLSPKTSGVLVDLLVKQGDRDDNQGNPSPAYRFPIRLQLHYETLNNSA